MNVPSLPFTIRKYGFQRPTFAKHLIISQIHSTFFHKFSSNNANRYIMNVLLTLSRRTLAIWILTIGLGFSGYSQKKFHLFSESTKPIPEAAMKGLKKGMRLNLSQSTFREIYQTEPESFSVTLPLSATESKTLTFYKTQVVSDDFKVTTSDGRELKGKEYSGLHYQINPKNQSEKVGTISFSKTEVMGIFSDEKGNWNLGILPETNGDYILYNERDLKVASQFHCETEDTKAEDHDHEKGPGVDKSVQTTGCKTVKMYFECDYRMYTDNGSNTSNVTTKVTGMFNNVKQLYANEQLDVELSQIFVWTTTDPYATETVAYNYLYNFSLNRASITQTLGHFLTTRPTSLGGIAYINVLCNPAAKFGFSNIYNSFSALPTYSWSVYCITHEMGHNFGSRHTHWCGWQLTGSTIGRIDSCYAGESVAGAVNCSNTTKPNYNGTIMSYCHVNGLINFNKGFGTLPGAAIRTGFSSASCIAGAAVPQYTVKGTGIVCEGGTVNLNITTAVTGATYSWTGPNGFTSSAQNPTIPSATPAASGQYNATLSKAGCTTDPKPVNVVVNGITSPPINETFEGTFLPPNWRIANPNGDRTFTKVTTSGGFGTSTSTMAFDNINLPFIGGRRDTVFLPVVNLTGLTGTTLKFDVAHAWNTVSFDTLAVVVSNNCGVTFKRVYTKTGTALATAPSTFSVFTPTSTQWRKETIDLTAYNGLGAVQIAIINVSGGTNFIYIDNVNLSTTGGSGGPSISLAALSQSSYCPGSSFSVGFTPSGTFNGGNQYTVQLSNASGSFTSPTVIGSGTTSPVSVTIPAGTSNGTGYLIRVIASNPAVTSSTTPAISISPLVVAAGSDQSICDGANSITLTASPAGGTWSGAGVTSGGVFTPTTALVGAQTLTYSTSSGGCSGTDQIVMTVKAKPSVVAGTNISTCSGNAPFALTGFSPAGGTWSGTGVSSTGTFTPASANLGSNSLTYTVTSNGCSNGATRNVTVSSTITVSAGSSQTACSNGSSLTLTGTPAGGTWSGSGVTSGGVFTPTSGLVGSNTLTYTVSGTCGGNDQTTVSVTAAPTVNAGIDQSFCSNDAPYTIVQGSPASGSWSGSGVSGNVFDPSSTTIGSHTLTYSVTQSGCTSSSTVDFTVNSTPVPSAGPDQNACVGGSNVSLSGTPAGGTWSGQNTTGAGVFTPLLSNIGPNSVTYTVTQNGCTGSATSIVQVYDIPTVSAGPDQSATAGSGDVALVGTPSGGTWSGIGVTGSTFSPASSGQGSFNLTYTYSQNGCSNSDELIFVVLPSVAVNAGSDVSVCETASPITLNGTPAGGTWSGNGVSPEGEFTPGSSLTGTQTLTYTVSGNGSDVVVITVNSLPTVNAGTDQTICSTSPNYSLTGATPGGGTWSGTGITGAGLITTSALSTSGSVFTYSVNQGGCSASGQVTITKVTPPTVNAGQNQNICKNATPVQLTGSPSGGTWSGSGVSASGLFNPASVSNGTKTLTYTVDGTLAGCAGSDQMTMTVFNIPTVAAGADRTTCSNAAPFLLTGTPTGGVWSGAGINSSGLFTPTTGLTGVQTVTYTVSQNGCSNSSTTNINVNSLPVVSAGSNLNVCANEPGFTISGASPSGGTWSGPSFVNAAGVCSAPFTAGTYTLTYSATVNGCSASSQLTMAVNNTPVVNAGNNRSVCANGNNLTLTGFSPAGGVWSGNGVSSGGIFSPSAALTGNQTLSYTVTQNGCSGTDQLVVNVKAIPAITTGANESACASGQKFKINGYSPRGGVWTGPGITQDSLFTPNPALVGTQTITYSVTKNGCSNSSQKTVVVNPPNVINPGTQPAQLCANATPVQFNGFSPAGGIWKGSGISPAGLLTPNSGLLGTQTYTYRLDLNGCRDSVQIQTVINPTPIVNAGPDLTACATGAAVALTNATPLGGVWSGAGVNDTGLFSPTAVTPGNINLTYSYSLNGCTASDILVINVSAAPVVNGGADRNICKNSVPVNLVGAPVGGTWSGTGVNTSGVFTATNNMSGNITLTYSINENGCTGSDQVVVSITNPVSVTAGSNQTVCDNENPLNLTGFSPAGGSWTGPGVTATGTFNPDSSLTGTQTLTYTVTSSNCTVKASKTMTVKNAPQVVAGSDLSICSNDSPVQLAGFSPAGGTWSGPAVNGTGLVTPGTSGPQVLSYSVTTNGCTGTDSRVVTVIPAPVIAAGPSQTVCGLGADISMEGYFPSGGSWTGTGITLQGVFSPVAANLGNAVTVTYSVTQNGCSSTATKTINVVNIPSVVAVASTANEGCEGSVIPLNLGLTNPASFIIQWQKNNSDLPNETSPVLATNTSGTYKAVIKASSCSVTSDSKTVNFIPVPETPTIAQSGTILISSLTSGNQWKKNGQIIPGATQNTYTPTVSGIYTAVGVNTSCESSPSNALTVTFTANEEILLQNPEIRLYPNPNQGRFVLELKGVKQSRVPVAVVDAFGRTVWSEEKEVQDNAVETEITLPGLAAGMYWFKADVGGNSLIRKVIIR